MVSERNKQICREVMERGFNQGDLTVWEEYSDPHGVDQQEPEGTDFIAHLKEVTVALRTAFPDLHFALYDMLAEGDRVAFRATMTGTHTGVFSLGPIRNFPPTGRRIAVPHLYLIHMENGKTTELWHEWNTSLMMQQLGIAPQPARP